MASTPRHKPFGDRLFQGCTLLSYHRLMRVCPTPARDLFPVCQPRDGRRRWRRRQRRCVEGRRGEHPDGAARRCGELGAAGLLSSQGASARFMDKCKHVKIGDDFGADGCACWERSCRPILSFPRPLVLYCSDVSDQEVSEPRGLLLMSQTPNRLLRWMPAVHILSILLFLADFICLASRL